MPYVVTNGSVAAITLHGKHENQQVMNVFHYRVSSGGSLTDGRAALQALMNAVKADDKLAKVWTAALSVKATQLKMRGQWISPTRFGFLEEALDPAVGGEAGDAMPVNLAASITRRTDNAGRDQVGTIHMPAIPTSFVLNGILTAGALTAYGDVLTQALEVLTTVDPAAEWFPILFHRTAPSVAQQLTGGTVQPTARVMRRRTVGLGS